MKALFKLSLNRDVAQFIVIGAAKDYRCCASVRDGKPCETLLTAFERNQTLCEFHRRKKKKRPLLNPLEQGSSVNGSRAREQGALIYGRNSESTGMLREQNLHQARQTGASRLYLPSSHAGKKIQESLKQNQANGKLSAKPKPVSQQLAKPASAEQKAKTALRTQGSYLDAHQQRIAEESAVKRSKLIKAKNTGSEPASVERSDEQMMLMAASDSDDD